MKIIIPIFHIFLLSCSSLDRIENRVIRLQYFRAVTEYKNSDSSSEFKSLKKCISHREEISIDELIMEFGSVYGFGSYKDFEILREDFLSEYCIEIKGRKNER